MAAILAAVVVVAANLEPPDVIAEFDAVEQPGLGEFGEVAVDRGPVESPAGEGRRHIGVGSRTAGRFQVLKHRQAGRGAPQAGRPDACSAGLAVRTG